MNYEIRERHENGKVLSWETNSAFVYLACFVVGFRVAEQLGCAHK